jgi:hypothetical protein
MSIKFLLKNPFPARQKFMDTFTEGVATFTIYNKKPLLFQVGIPPVKAALIPP